MKSTVLSSFRHVETTGGHRGFQGEKGVACCFQSDALEEFFRESWMPPVRVRLDSSLDREEYCLRIGETGPAEISASTPAGAYYGFCSLKRLQRPDGAFPLCDVEDAPELAIRGIHVALVHSMPRFERMKEIVRQFSRWKINMLVLEYDDHFPWTRHPELVARDCWTREELAEIIRYAEEHFIEVVPLLDSLGHASQYLKHRCHQDLAEIPGDANEMCPQNPDVLQFMEDLWEEVLAMHPHSRFAHITGDEVFRLGQFCPKCAKAAADGQLGAVFGKYYTALSRFIISHGKIPVMWDDMLLKYPEIIDNLPRDIVMNHWNYMGYDADRWDIQVMPHCRPERAGELASYFAPSMDFRADGSCRSYPGIFFLQSKGYQVLAASSSSMAIYPLPELRPRHVNQRRMSQAAMRDKAMGILNTFWNTWATLEGGWLNFFFGAEYAWRPWPERDDGILDEFNASFLGCGELPPNYLDFWTRLNQWLYQGGCDLPDNPPDLPEGHPWLEFLKLNFRYAMMDAKALQRGIARFEAHVPKSQRQIPLDSLANATAKTSLPRQFDVFPLEKKTLEFAGRRFDIDPDRLLSLKAGDTQPHVLPVNDLATEVNLLGYGCYVPEGSPVFFLDFHYQDGATAHIDIHGKDEFCDWYGGIRRAGKNFLPFATVMLNHEIPLHIGMTRIENPFPDKRIDSISFLSANCDKCVCVIIAAAIAKASSPMPPPMSRQETAKIKAQYHECLDKIRKWNETYCDPMPYDDMCRVILDASFSQLDALTE